MSDPVLPTPEQMQRRLQELLRTTFAAPGNSPEKPETPVQPADKVPPAILDFRLTPREVKAHLDRFVIRQDDAKKVLGIAVCDHYNNARMMASREAGAPPLEYAKQNVLIAGPTGVGKTYLVKHVADLIGVPFVKADATKFSETGYVGGDVEDLVRELVQKADGNVALAQYGIIYIDEIDKIATASEAVGRDVSGRGVQTTLLKLMEETEVGLRGGNDLQSQIQAALEFQKRGKVSRESINTRHILFIVSGAFDKLTGVVSRRLKKSGIGFGADPAAATDSPAELMQLAGTRDFVDYGLEPEFIGRLPVRVVCESLAEKDLFDILKQSEGSLIRQYERAFAAYGIEAVFSDEALRRIALLAVRETTGARGLMTVCERLLREFKYRLPGSPVRILEVTPAVLDNPDAAIEHLLQAGEAEARQAQRMVVAQFAERFGEQHGFLFRFSPEAVEAILRQAVEKNISARDLCEGLFKDYEFGLGLIQRNSGQADFEIPAEAVESPDRVLSRWVVASHRTNDEQP
jgi:endopeptidase Clp ATP-binding regulatory subunit ClpX